MSATDPAGYSNLKKTEPPRVYAVDRGLGRQATTVRPAVKAAVPRFPAAGRTLYAPPEPSGVVSAPNRTMPSTRTCEALRQAGEERDALWLCVGPGDQDPVVTGHLSDICPP